MTLDLFVKLDPQKVSGAVDLALREAIAKELGRDPDALVKAVVEAALKEGGTGSYNSRGSLFKLALDKIITEEATARVGQILEEERPRIVEALRNKIDAGALIDSFLERTSSLWIAVGGKPDEGGEA